MTKVLTHDHWPIHHDILNPPQLRLTSWVLIAYARRRRRSALSDSHSLTLRSQYIITGRIFPKGSSAGISFTHGPISGFFAPQGRLVASIKVKFGREERTVLPVRFRGGVLRPPKLKKKSNFTNIIAPKGRVHCTIFIKFTQFMRVLSLHNVTKFGCFISINDKIINNLLRWGRFQPNFRRPLAAKLWMGPKNVYDLK